MVLGLAKPEQLSWDHVDCRFGVNGGHDSSEDIDGCNGCKCYKWHTDG